MSRSVDTTRIFLWSGPRNISTTLMYSFAQRADTQVFDEPLYGYYLSNTKAKEYHPDAEIIKNSMECDGNKVVQQMLEFHEKPVAFFKNMTHHLLNLDLSFLNEGVNVILTRDPKEMIPSFDKVIKNPYMEDVGYAAQAELVDYFLNQGIKFFVLDSKKVMLNPQEQLIKACENISIPFSQNMLQWKKGARPEDGVWAKHWYKSIHNSIGFKKYEPKKEPFPKRLEPLLEFCMPIYKRLLEYAIK